ncbi:hypothetical protein RIF29_19355 [Crotalaria pallida]|uniref:RING-type E3 ubiquitin transferase BRCA1 n=1 Tax=Crotalaria pallida TaxID=3830 RepID=A0AAN9F147_CROPI
MKSVVATVSGYDEPERFDLIKMITYAGANYVEEMSKSNKITHLVSWKFEGKEFNNAKKWNIIIVNHQWFEDCIKEGRRVLEDPYTWQRYVGVVVGEKRVWPLLLKVPHTVKANCSTKKKVISDRSYDIGSEKQTTEISSGSSGNSAWEDFLMNKHEEVTSHSSRLSRKHKRNIHNDNGVSNVAGPSRKGRRTVKNIVDEVVLDPIILDLTREEDHLPRVSRLHTNAAATSSHSGGVNSENIQENREGLDAGLHNQRGTVNIASDGIQQIKDTNDICTNGDSTLFEEDPLPTSQTSGCSSPEKFTDGNQIDPVGTLPTPKELSCVICFEEYSSTRGILPCGHRYCYPCIQSWIARRTSIGKSSTCPLCKASFVMLKKVEHAATADQKVYSQTIPSDNSASDVYIGLDQELPDHGFEFAGDRSLRICSRVAMFAESEKSICIAWTLLYYLGHAVTARIFGGFFIITRIIRYALIHCNQWNPQVCPELYVVHGTSRDEIHCNCAELETVQF